MAFSLTQASIADIMGNLIPPGSGLIYTNETLVGDPRCAALFTGGEFAVTDASTKFPSAGFVLGTGAYSKLNDQDGTQAFTDFGLPGDEDINTSGLASFDACYIEFLFKCDNIGGGDLLVDYVLASDEYIEQVTENTGFADEFALLLNDVNIATVPVTGEFVSVYTVNHLTNTEYFVYNDPRPGQALFPLFEPDGFTKCLNATGVVNGGGAWNKMKVGVVDVNDAFLDSWVFFEEGSFECVVDPTPSPTFAPTPAPTPAPTSSPTPAPTPAPTSAPIPNGGASGDPHFRTFDDQFFSYHGQCDLVLTRSNNFASGSGLDVHIRTTRVNNPHMDYSYISGAAVKIGDDVLEVSDEGELIINGESMVPGIGGLSFAGLHDITQTVKGKNQQITAYNLDLGNDMSIEIRVNAKNGMLFVDMNGSFADSEGLLGADPKEGKPLLARDGTTDLTGYWNTYGEEWQVNDVDPKLFQDMKRHPQYPKSCVYEAKMKKSHVRGRRLMETNVVSIEAATDACAHLEKDHMKAFCVDDVMATGDLDLVEDPFYAN